MLRDIYTIWLRDWRMFLSNKLEVLISLVWPIVLIFTLGLGVDSFMEISSIGSSYTSFLGPGVIAMFAFFGATNVGYAVIEDKRGFIKEMLVSPLNRSAIISGKILGSMTSFVLLFIVLTAIVLLYSKTFTFTSFVLSLFLAFFISFGAHGFGILLASVLKSAKVYQYVAGFLYMGIAFLSGVFFPIKNLPIYLKWFTYINPLTYGVDALRWSTIGVGEFNIWFNVLILAIFALIMIFLGAWLFHRTIDK